MRRLYSGDLLFFSNGTLAANITFSLWDDANSGSNVTSQVLGPDGVSTYTPTTTSQGLRMPLTGPDNYNGLLYCDTGTGLRFPMYPVDLLDDVLQAAPNWMAGGFGGGGGSAAYVDGGTVGTNTDPADNVPTVPITFGGAVATVGVTNTNRAYVARTLKGARMRVAGAPIGSALTVQVQSFDTTWTTVATLTMPASSTAEVVSTFTKAQVAGNLLRLNVTSVGATTPATGVAVDILWT